MTRTLRMIVGGKHIFQQFDGLSQKVPIGMCLSPDCDLPACLSHSLGRGRRMSLIDAPRVFRVLGFPKPRRILVRWDYPFSATSGEPAHLFSKMRLACMPWAAFNHFCAGNGCGISKRLQILCDTRLAMEASAWLTAIDHVSSW